jgi:hypothetical protein
MNVSPVNRIGAIFPKTNILNPQEIYLFNYSDLRTNSFFAITQARAIWRIKREFIVAIITNFMKQLS